MYYLLTNMTKDENPLSENIFLSINYCKVEDFRDSLWGDIVVYYALYNNRDLKLATYKYEKDWLHSNEYKILNKTLVTLERIVRFANYGEKIAGLDDSNLRLDMKDRLLTPEQQDLKVVEYLKSKWINELNW